MSGLISIFWKELSDHFTSKRFIILFLIIYVAGIAAIYMAAQYIRTEVTDETKFIFLHLYTVSGGNLPSFPFFLSLFIPIVGNGKATRQPIYVCDVAKGIVDCVWNEKTYRKLYPLAGKEIVSFNELVEVVEAEGHTRKFFE